LQNSTRTTLQPSTLWERKNKELAVLEIFLWILFVLSIIGLFMLFSPYIFDHKVTDYLVKVSFALVPSVLIIQMLLSVIRTTLARNFILIGGIKFGKKVDQLTFLAQKTHFQDKISFGRRIYAIAALADLGDSETISHLEKLVNDKKFRVRKHATLAITEINLRITSKQENNTKSKGQNIPYKDLEDNYVSLFGFEKNFIRHIIINLIIGLIIAGFTFSIVLSSFDLSQLTFNSDSIFLIMLLFLFSLYTIFILYLLITILIRMKKITHCIKAKNVYGLIQIAEKSGFNLLRYVKMAAISGLGDIGSIEANSILHTFSMDRMIEIQNRAITSLDMISIKNNQEKRYYFEFN